ncbi:helix-turn-helix domain-containing protein [Natrinema halophilum]|uniref:helix-turn-helix domain-containing protein n=1 Tax=Natrinema halophilum TaxID=1699371 RepID=UPI001F19A06A|nr:helix-turn-helix domain-containing protein [Natrinema halophilum]UHQ96137.1 helix-turn-helix domain-containing protein [Natrinema halophilum]
METEQTAADVFGLLSDEIRLEILRTVALAQHEKRQTGVTELSFSDIYDRVSVDNTSKLSYHLGELTGTFLRKHENGYAFTHAGEQLVRFILAENFRSPPDFGTIETDGRCLFCGESPLEAQLEEQYFMIRCSECDRPAFSYRIRPAQARSHSGPDLIDAVIWEQVGDFLKMQQGVCPDCAGHFDTEVMDAESTSVGDLVPVSYGVVNECQQCQRVMGVPLPYAAVYHPESIAFHWDHGVDVLGTGAWEFHRYLQDGQWTSEQIQTAPDEYRVELQRETSALRLLLDKNATVTRTERVRHSDQHGRR